MNPPGSSGGLVGRQVGNYVVEEELAAGAQGSVFRARHVQLAKPVALKVLHQRGVELLVRFEREGRLLANLQHPLLPRVHEVVKLPDGRPALSMELIEGESLDRLVKRQGRPELGWTLELFASLADCLAFCHQNGVVHRDLKPANLLLEQRTGRPLLVDFGLARSQATQTGDSLTKTGELVGTPAYMAPEQAAGERHEVGPATDVYALGATLFFLLAERPPFQGKLAYEYVKAALEDPAPDVRTFNDQVPGAVAELLDRLLAKDPAERPAASEVAEELRRILTTQGLAGPGPHSGVAKAVEREVRAQGGRARPGFTRRFSQKARGRSPLLSGLLIAALGLTALLIALRTRPEPEPDVARTSASPSPDAAPAEPAEPAAPTRSPTPPPQAPPPPTEPERTFDSAAVSRRFREATTSHPLDWDELDPALADVVADPGANVKDQIDAVELLRTAAREADLLPAVERIVGRFPAEIDDFENKQIRLLALRAVVRAEARTTDHLEGALADAERVLTGPVRRGKRPGERWARYAKALAHLRRKEWTQARDTAFASAGISLPGAMLVAAEIELHEGRALEAQIRLAGLPRQTWRYIFYEPYKHYLLLARAYAATGKDYEARAILFEVLTEEPGHEAAKALVRSLD